MVRSIPEFQTSVPIGFDTAIYLATAREMAGKIGVFPFYFQMLALLYSLGIDLLAFMKIFPTLVYAGTVALAAGYADKRLGWSQSRVFVLVLVMTLSAPMLRMSWDLHRQDLGTLLILLAVYLNLYAEPSPKKTLGAIFLNSVIGVLHEIVLTVAAAIPLYSALRGLRHGDKPKTIQLLVIAAAPFISYELGLLSAGSFFIPTEALENVTATFGSYSTIVSQQIGIFLAFYWALAPLAALGFFRDLNLGPWLAITTIAGFSRMLFPWFAVQLADRWMLYMAVPLIFYAAEAISRLLSMRTGTLVRLAITGTTFLLLSVQGIGMLGFSPFQLGFFAQGFPNLMPATMVFSTASEQHVATVIKFVDFVNGHAESSAIVTYDPWFYYWAKYESNVPVVPFSAEGEINAVVDQARSHGYSTVYVIWFDGHLSSDVVLRENQLALYEVPRDKT